MAKALSRKILFGHDEMELQRTLLRDLPIVNNAGYPAFIHEALRGSDVINMRPGGTRETSSLVAASVPAFGFDIWNI